MGRKRLAFRKWASFWLRFPPELFIEVLARLPVKALLKFRCVCKEWRSLIDSPEFASMHFNLYNSKNDRLFLIESEYYGRQCSVRQNDTFQEITAFVSLKPNFCFLRVESYVHGLVLFSKLSFGLILGFVVWNPSIRKSVEIPAPDPSCLPHVKNVMVKFVCVSGVANGYKVVIMPLQNQSESNPSLDLIQVYSLDSGSWTSSSIITQCQWSFTAIDRTPLNFLNGAVHWIGRDASMASSPSDGYRIVVFDVQNVAFDHFSLPDEMGIHRSRILAVLGESLALWDMELVSSAIWVMEQYGVAESWIKRYTISCEFGRILYFKSNGELLVTMKKYKLHTYDPRSEELRYVTRSYKDRIIFMDTFMESLVLPRSDKELNKS